jgi:hypothetical protein
VKNSSDSLLARRLVNQRLRRPPRQSAADVVAWMGAVQAQEYGPAKWGVGQRAAGLTDADVERAFNDAAIVRTHVLRPTWHFVTARDVRWLLTLTAPHVCARMAPYNRHLGLDGRVFRRSHDAIARALEGGRHLTRPELKAVLARRRIDTSSFRMAHLMMRAELDQVVCSGPRRDKQFTYALLSERVPPGPSMSREEALAELASRYIASHGPATARDFSWWSGLRMADVKRALESVTPALRRDVVDGRTFWSFWSTPATPPGGVRLAGATYLLPIYDEYLVAYKDRDVAIDPRTRGVDAAIRDDFGHYLIVDGKYTGAWRWTNAGGRVAVKITPYRTLTTAEQRRLDRAIRTLAAF